jgi:hypothetical protein
MSDTSDGIDPDICTEIYDISAAIMAFKVPTPQGLTVGIGTHLAGEYFCNGGTLPEPGPPPDYFGGKLGYDPANEAPPTFTPSDDFPESPFIDLGANTGGFDYSAADNHASIGGFDYAAADSHDAYSGSNSGGSEGSSDGGSSGSSLE